MGGRTSRPSRPGLVLASVVAISVASAPATAGAPDIRTALERNRVGARVDEAKDVIPAAWLGETVSLEQVEAENPGITDARLKRFPEAGHPFGFQNPQWEALKAEMRPGDLLRTFASPPESWQHLAGRAGIALVRDGAVVDSMLTIMN